MKKILITFTVLILGAGLYSQQDAMYTHYMFNTLAVNPGYAGSRDITTVTALNRSQWVGFEGAPITQTITLHSPIFSESIGGGLSFVNDRIGPIRQTSIYADLSYKINLSSDVKLSFGVKGGGNIMQGDLANVSTINNNDNAFASISGKFKPNAGVGVYLSNERWYLGASVPKLIENSLDIVTTTTTLNKEKRHYFLIAGMAIELNDYIVLKPTSFIKATVAAPIQADLTAMLVIDEKLELGLMGRTGDGMGAIFGYSFTPQLRAGYAFDWSFANTTGAYNSGSHEIMLRYDIIDASKTRLRSPRYF